MKTLRINPVHMERILAHCHESFPNEACGILAGVQDTVEEVYPMRNAEPSSVSYQFDSREQMLVLRDMQRQERRLVGLYHSHPQSPARPSTVDIERAFFPGTREVNFPGVAFVIVSLMDNCPEVRAFLIEPDRVVEIDLVVE